MKKYAICGLSNRAIGHFILPMMGNQKLPEYGDYSQYGKIVGILDIDIERMRVFNKNQGTNFPIYGEDEFDKMIAETKPDVVVVVTQDVFHAKYTIKALEHNIDVITEKPMVIDCKQAKAVMDAEAKSKGKVYVAFNFRYATAHTAIKRMIMDGLVGKITNIEFVYNLDTYHGSSYFYRWNRYRACSGGLTITKDCHHFDLINWWLDDIPEEVFAFGALNYFGSNSPFKPYKNEKEKPSVDEIKKKCPYHKRWFGLGSKPPKDDHLNAYEAAFNLPYNVQYPEPLYIYDEGIDIEDTYSAVVRYKGGASMSYSLNASSPWEGYILGINGTKGRIETKYYTAENRLPFTYPGHQKITYIPLFGEAQVHETRKIEGCHDGADEVAKQDMFVGLSDESKELNIVAGSKAGAYAVAVGEAMWRSVKEKRSVVIKDLFDGGSDK